MDEVSNGTSRYRSLHSLTGQIEHQYHGRFLIELIQNAHDALLETGDKNRSQRIEIVISEDESSSGALYIANDGQPFTQSNFRALANLGQSDKDPKKSIGNKGIGFRSVLEITKSPEIYSRKTRDSGSFDGYCFSFRPDVIQMFKSPIRKIVDGDECVESPVEFGGKQLLGWDTSRYAEFRDLCRRFESNWLLNELAYLSPYALPIPLDSQKANARIIEFEDRGFSTVVRLPFIDERAKDIANEKLKEMDANTIIFLQRVNKFSLVSEDDARCYQRKEKPIENDPQEGSEIKVTSVGYRAKQRQNPSSKYWLWTKTIGGEVNPIEREEIQSAVSDLPGKWPNVDEAKVGFAVQIGSAPVDGVLNIYLPTKMLSGCAAHFSAPFYGDISRTEVDFGEEWNSLLLNKIAEKATKVVFESLMGKTESEAAAIIDILAPAVSNEGVRWWEILEEKFTDQKVEIESQDIMLSDRGWDSLQCTSLLPNLDSMNVVDETLYRSEATYSVFVEALGVRERGIRRLFRAVHIRPVASTEDCAKTVEAVVKKLHTSQISVDWNGLWEDIISLLDSEATPLIGKEVLLGTDNQLHACNVQCSVFFRPSRSGNDDKYLVESGIENIPESLRSFIAFLHEDIQTHFTDEWDYVETTAVCDFLSSELVQRYEVERIFSDVLLKATPELPHALKGCESLLCRDILNWGLKLFAVAADTTELNHLLGKIPVPCIGGWYPLCVTSFGNGWPETRGRELDEYLRLANTPECKKVRERLLLPPDHPLWGEFELSSASLLEKAGVFDGIRLVSVSSNDWEAEFTVSGRRGLELPNESPPSFTSELWEAYREFARSTVNPRYESEFPYVIREIFRLPGLERLESFDQVTRKLLMNLILHSMSSWGIWCEDWEETVFEKLTGEWSFLRSESPLAFALRKLTWMHDEVNGKSVNFSPSDRWYIPTSSLVGGLHMFTHLMPMPDSIASILDENVELVELMKKLGMPKYEPEEQTSDPRLLNDLAKAWKDSSIEISNNSFFLGQVRSAWSQFSPDGEVNFPSDVLVHKGSQALSVVTPKNEILYLPDADASIHNGLELHSKPVIAIHSVDAKRLKENFQDAYDDNILCASELTTKALVSDDQWQIHDNLNRLSEELPWIIPVILSVFAYSGSQVVGSSTKTFTRAVDRLREARVDWVERLRLELWHKDSSIASIPVPSLWLSKENVLIAKTEAQTEVSQLSRDLASIVDRSDINIHLKYALKRIEGIDDEITDEVICSSLSDLEITSDLYQEILQRWMGDLAWKLRLVKPLILLLQPGADVSKMRNVSSEDDFDGVLKMYNFGSLGYRRALALIENETGLKSIGYSVWEILGDEAQLFLWNQALLKAGESLVANDLADEQFEEQLVLCRGLLRSIVRLVLHENLQADSFKELESRLLNLECPSEYQGKYWVVGFYEVMGEIHEVLREWFVPPKLLQSIRSAKTAEELHNQLKKHSLQPEVDPIEVHAKNHEYFFRVLKKVRKIAIAWCLQEGIGEGIWGESDSYFEENLIECFEKDAYLDVWNERRCFDLISRVSQSEDHEEFCSLLRKCSSKKELACRLGVSEAKLSVAEEQLEQRRLKKNLQAKTKYVCGSEFVNSEENLSELWNHLHEVVEDDDVVVADLTEITELIKPIPGGNGQTPNGGRGTINTMSRADKELVGLAGEIHAFRGLKRLYGKKNVGSANWISENSRCIFPKNNVDDGFGCDFIVEKNGKTYYVEVKASQNENYVFELGSSEVSLAIRLANRRNSEFLILHVLNALDDYFIRILPNPYSKKFKDMYRFEEAGFRVRYEV